MTATDARSLAHDLLQRDDASLVALLVARGVSPSVTWSDAFDAAEALLDPASAERAVLTVTADEADALTAATRGTEPGAVPAGAVRDALYARALVDPDGIPYPAIAEALRVHGRPPRDEIRRRSLDMLNEVQIRDPERVLKAYPHELSGGMGQRVMIAMMLVTEPELLIADEPTSALDVTVQLEVLRILDDLVRRRGMGLIFISHDLRLVSTFCDRVLVMYRGRIVEEIEARRLHEARHPYTQGLLAAIPLNENDQKLVADMTATVFSPELQNSARRDGQEIQLKALQQYWQLALAPGLAAGTRPAVAFRPPCPPPPSPPGWPASRSARSPAGVISGNTASTSPATRSTPGRKPKPWSPRRWSCPGGRCSTWAPAPARS